MGVAAGIVSHLKLSLSNIAMPYHVWVHQETDETPCLAPFAFGEMVAENLRKYGADVRLEGEAPLDDCLVCIFLLSPSFFGCERSLSLMRRAVEQGKPKPNPNPSPTPTPNPSPTPNPRPTPNPSPKP